MSRVMSIKSDVERIPIHLFRLSTTGKAETRLATSNSKASVILSFRVQCHDVSTHDVLNATLLNTLGHNTLIGLC